MRIAIIIGVSKYGNEDDLPACVNDAEAIAEVLKKSGRYADICLQTGNVSAASGKKAITDFVSKYRDKTVDELFFYFSGHGSKAEDDFLHVFSDYRPLVREATTLRNTELDSLIRNLAPRLTVKVVDSCFSGSQYIKGSFDIRSSLQKSAEKASLNDVYFLHSSSSTETSLAGEYYSWFTKSFLAALVHAPEGELRYRDLAAAVADDLAATSGAPSPNFVMQGTMLETFVEVTDDLTNAVISRLSVDPDWTYSKTASQESSNQDSQRPAQPAGLLALATKFSEEVFCTEEEATKNLTALGAVSDAAKWPSDILDVFEVTISDVGTSDTPNAVEVGEWLLTIEKSEELFAQPAYRTEMYQTEEYRKNPRKPHRAIPSISLTLSSLLGDDDYKLVTVDKSKQVIDGFCYTVDPVLSPKILRFVPKFPSLENYSATVLCFFSRRVVYLTYSVEHLSRTGWGDISPARAKNWKSQRASLKDTTAITRLAQSTMDEIADFIRADINLRFGSLKI